MTEDLLRKITVRERSSLNSAICCLSIAVALLIIWIGVLMGSYYFITFLQSFEQSAP